MVNRILQAEFFRGKPPLCAWHCTCLVVVGEGRENEGGKAGALSAQANNWKINSIYLWWTTKRKNGDPDEAHSQFLAWKSHHPRIFRPPFWNFPTISPPNSVRARHGKVANNAKGQKTKTASCNNFLIGAEIADGIDAMKGNFGLQAARLLANLLLNAKRDAWKVRKG